MGILKNYDFMTGCVDCECSRWQVMTDEMSDDDDQGICAKYIQEFSHKWLAFPPMDN